MSEQSQEVLEGVPDMLKDKLLDLSSKLDEVEIIAKLIENKPVKEIQGELSAIEEAKYNWISIYAINSLFFSIFSLNFI